MDLSALFHRDILVWVVLPILIFAAGLAYQDYSYEEC